MNEEEKRQAGQTAADQTAADQAANEQEALPQPSRDMEELHKTVDMACEILHRTHDGDDLSPSDLKLTECAVNGQLTERGLEAFADLHKRVTEGTYLKPWLNGIEPFTNDHAGYVYYKGIQVEHYNRDFMYTAAAKRALCELKGRCEYLESIGAEVGGGNAVWGWHNYAADHGRGKFEELRKFLAENVRASGGLPEDWGFDYARVSVIDGRGLGGKFCTLDVPKSLDDLQRHEVTRDMSLWGELGKEFHIEVTPCHYGGAGVVDYRDIVNDTGAFDIYSADLLLETCHEYLTRQRSFEALPAEKYKTDFGEKQAAIDELNKLLDAYKTDGGGSLTYSLITVRDRYDVLNVFCLLGEPDAEKLSRLHGVIGALACLDEPNEADVFVDVYRYGTGAELEITDAAAREAIESSLDVCEAYLSDFDLSECRANHHYNADDLRDFMKDPVKEEGGNMKLAYVASPLRAVTPEDMARNREQAALYCRAVADFRDCYGNYFAPVSPVLNFAAFDDNDPKQRHNALNMGLAILEKCDVLVAAGSHVSEGMRGEIQAAARLGMPIMGYGVSEEEIQAAKQGARPLLGIELTVGGAEDYGERLLIMKPEAMKNCFRTPENQLVYCTHGNGASPGRISDTIFTDNIITGDGEVWGRNAVLGVANVGKLPDWARDAWEKFQQNGYKVQNENAQGGDGRGAAREDGENGAEQDYEQEGQDHEENEGDYEVGDEDDE